MTSLSLSRAYLSVSESLSYCWCSNFLWSVFTIDSKVFLERGARNRGSRSPGVLELSKNRLADSESWR